MLLKTNKESQIGNYMFKVNGGAIGTYRTGIKIPAFQTFIGMWFIGGFLTGGAGATLSIGWITLDQDPAFGNPTEFNSAQLLAFYNSPKAMDTVNSMNPFASDMPLELTVSIGVAPITNNNGFLTLFCDYYSRDKLVF